MSMDPLVSVIIPTRNSARTIEKCLASIRNQSYQNIELIVVDNNSADNTKEIASKYTDKVFNQGPERSAQRNFGASKANGAYLLIHDSDIYFDEDSVKECVQLMQIEKCQALILPEKSIGTGFWTKVKAFERSFYIGNDYIEAVRFFNRDFFFSIGKYDETLTGPEDWELTTRIRKAGHKVGRTKKILLHDEGQLNLFGSSKKKKYYAKDMFEKYARMHPDYFKKQMNFFVRFPVRKLLIKGARHPMLCSAMILMKGMEYMNARR